MDQNRMKTGSLCVYAYLLTVNTATNDIRAPRLKPVQILPLCAPHRGNDLSSDRSSLLMQACVRLCISVQHQAQASCATKAAARHSLAPARFPGMLGDKCFMRCRAIMPCNRMPCHAMPFAAVHMVAVAVVFLKVVGA